MKAGFIVIAGCSLILSTFSACTPVAEEDANEPAVTQSAEAAQPKFRSAKEVSSICDVDFWAPTMPGFAEPAGREQLDMPPPIAEMMSVGADRPMIETDHERVAPGYTLIEPFKQTTGMLINNSHEIVATLEYLPVPPFSEILPSGHRVIASGRYNERFQNSGGALGCLEEFDAAGNLLWQLNLSSDSYINHHDFAVLPNGNILSIVWESISADEVISQGRNPENVADNGDFWYGGVIEIDPYNAEIVWEWSARHHLVQDFDSSKANYGVVADHPELIDINRFGPGPDGSIDADWTHFNAIDYDPDLEQILLSSPRLGEIFVIDHSTTPFEAAGHSGGRYGKGGDILYRWGNAANYNRGTQEDRELWGQHDAQWIRDGLNGAGNILVFNNGGRDRPWSTVVEITPPMNADGSYAIENGAAFGPAEKAWEYDPEPPERFFSFFISGAQRLPNGNTLVNQGAGAKLREVTQDGDIVWEYRWTDYDELPDMLFRATKFPPDHPGVLKMLEAQRN